jgi:AraC family transcriptional regulator
MDWVTTLREAIDYMENHLLESISYEDVAKHLHISNFHFHRIFSLATGMTANEYIRNRRLSLAGRELTLSNVKVIDVSLKYRYDSPESFTKAFSRFHGTTPNSVRNAGIKLKSFSRLIIKFSMEGGTVMDYRIEERNTIRLLAKTAQFPNESVQEGGINEIPAFWKKSICEKVPDMLAKTTGSKDLYGACAPISKDSSSFEYGIGMEYDGSTVPEGFRIWTIDEGLWAVFACFGKTPDCIGDMWKRITSEFLPGSNYVMRDATDFEFYPADHAKNLFGEIWVPVEMKK